MLKLSWKGNDCKTLVGGAGQRHAGAVPAGGVLQLEPPGLKVLDFRALETKIIKIVMNAFVTAFNILLSIQMGSAPTSWTSCGCGWG